MPGPLPTSAPCFRKGKVWKVERRWGEAGRAGRSFSMPRRGLLHPPIFNTGNLGRSEVMTAKLSGPFCLGEEGRVTRWAGGTLSWAALWAERICQEA